MISMFINQNAFINFIYIIKSLDFKNLGKKDSWHVNWEFDQIQDIIKTVQNTQYPRPDVGFSNDQPVYPTRTLK